MMMKLIWAMVSNDAVGDGHEGADTLTIDLTDERVFANWFISRESLPF